MKIGWIGFHVEGLLALRGVLEEGICIEAVITLMSDRAAKRSGAADYSSLCREFGLPLYHVANINDEAALSLLKNLSLDLAFVIGWTQVLRPEALRAIRVGAIGAHASLLPHNRGRAPINWALIKGEKLTGNSLIWLAEGVDRGDIIAQTEIPITAYDTCASLYDRVAESNKDMILRALQKLLDGQRPGYAQPRTNEPDLPGRQPKDGLINWAASSREVYDFTRALTRPYPGAFSWLDGKRWTIWHCAAVPGGNSSDSMPGQVLGAVFSPIDAACGQAVACAGGTIILLELESEDGIILEGNQLSDQNWTGKVWTND